MVDGIYRISGIASNIKRLKAMFDTQTVPEPLHKEDWIQQDLHCVPSLIKLFFRELPEPIFPEKIFPLLKKGAVINALNSDTREALPCFKEAITSLGPAQFKTLKHLMFHLQKVAQDSKDTGMSSKNLAIVWAPNLIRTPLSQAATAEQAFEHTKLQHNLVQNTQIVQYLIDNAKWLFLEEPSSKKESTSGNHAGQKTYHNNNQLPPQFLERVKFINIEDQPISLSKRSLECLCLLQNLIDNSILNIKFSGTHHLIKCIILWSNRKKAQFSFLIPMRYPFTYIFIFWQLCQFSNF